MRSSVTFIVDHDETTDYLVDFAESVAREYASGDIVMVDYTVKVDLPMAWFVNEDGNVYDCDATTQRERFPNDFHRAFDTEAEAQQAADNLAAIQDLLRPVHI